MSGFFKALIIGRGVNIQTPTELPPTDGLVLTGNTDGTTFWTTGGGGSGVPEAPNTGDPYVRESLTWVDGTTRFDVIGSAAAVQTNLDTHTGNVDIHFADAPSDGTQYARINNGWAAVAASGESNEGENLPAPGALVYAGMSGVNLTFRRFNSADSSVIITENINNLDLQATAASVGADPAGSAAAVQSNLDSHTSNVNIHFTDAPDDGDDYVRNMNLWVAKTIGDVFSPAGTVGGNNIVLFDIADPDGKLIRDSGTTFLANGSGNLVLSDDGTYRKVEPDVAIADGDLLAYDGTNYYKLGVGTDGQVLTARPGAAAQAKLVWETVAAGGGEANTQTNQGAGAELALTKSGVDLPIRTLISGDASVTFTELADTLDIRATGAGGGEANRGENVGVGANEWYAGMNGVNLTFKTFNVANGLSVSDVGNTIGFGFDLDYQPLGTGEGLIDFQISPGNELKVKSLTSSNSSVSYSSNANEVDLVVTAASVGADPAGTATAAVAAHDADAGAHGGVEAAFTAHITPQVNSHGAIDTHIGTANIHFTEASIDHTAILNVGTNTHAQIDTHIATANIHVDHTSVLINAGDGLTGGGDISASRTIDVQYGGSGGDFGVATSVARSDHLHAQYLTEVVEDTTPVLGGDLQTKGNVIFFTRSDDSFQGIITAMTTTPGAAFVYSSDGSAYDENDGAVTVEPGTVSLYGTSARVLGLSHTVEGGRQVYVSESGTLFGVDPPPPGWFESDTDIGTYLRVGIGLNVWQQITGLQITVPEDVNPGDALDVFAEVQATNGTSNRTGVVEIGFGLNGAQPTASGNPFLLPENFDGPLNSNIRTTTATLTAGDTVEIWVRVTSQSNTQFSDNLVFDGSGTLDHEMSAGIPGSSGGGGTGDVTGPGSSVAGNLASYLDTTGKIIADSGKAASDVVTGPASAVNGNIASYSGTTGKIIADSSVAISELITGDGTATKMVALGQAAYDALSPPDATTVYLINGP